MGDARVIKISFMLTQLRPNVGLTVIAVYTWYRARYSMYNSYEHARNRYVRTNLVHTHVRRNDRVQRSTKSSQAESRFQVSVGQTDRRIIMPQFPPIIFCSFSVRCKTLKTLPPFPYVDLFISGRPINS